MADINYNASISHYEMLSRLKGNWQLKVASSVVVEEGMSVDVIEVDSDETPTGNVMSAEVIFVDCAGDMVFIGKEQLFWCRRL
jgi:hypothetical protein